jgi:hypothetical protein
MIFFFKKKKRKRERERERRENEPKSSPEKKNKSSLTMEALQLVWNHESTSLKLTCGLNATQERLRESNEKWVMPFWAAKWAHEQGCSTIIGELMELTVSASQCRLPSIGTKESTHSVQKMVVRF